MQQGTQVLLVVTILAIANVNFLHSGNVEIATMAGFVGYMIWTLVGYYLIYRAQT